MKVLFVGMYPLEYIAGDVMEAHIVSALKALGATVKFTSVFGSNKYGNSVRQFLELAMTDFGFLDSTPVERALLATVKDFDPDVVLMLLGNYIPPSTVQKIRKISQAPITCWCQDHMGTMGRQYVIGCHYDYVFAKDQVMVDRFRQYTSLKEVHYLAEACNPHVHMPIVPTDEDMNRYGCDVTTAGSVYYFRAEILGALTEFDMKIWGPVPRYYMGPLKNFCTKKPVFMRDKAACFNAAKIVLNSLFPMEMGGLNARAFEIAGCGGFQLMSESDALVRHFEPGKEIETFANLGELQDKVRYYLAHDSERRSIAVAGRERAHAEHTYTHRLKEMFDIMGMRLPAP